MTQALVCWKQKISIHALREEGDLYFMALYYNHDDISIHALREEGDAFARLLLPGQRISIHALREEGDQATVRIPAAVAQFLSTPSARRATKKSQTAKNAKRNFYPRPPRGGRRHWHIGHRRIRHFYPRPPRGGRLWPMFSGRWGG